MADANSTVAIDPKAKIDGFDQAYLALVRAKGILDLIYSLPDSSLESLMEGTLSNSLDTALQQLHQVESYFDGIGRLGDSHV